LRWLYERFDLVLAPSRIMCDYLRSLGLRRVALQPLGVDAQVFNPAHRSDGLRRELGLPERVRLLAYAGRFSGEKNIPLLHAAMAGLGSEYHLLLIGGGEHRRPAANITVMPYCRDSVELAGRLASVDALIHAGTAETFGLVVIEAMACGRPVVGDDSVGALSEHADAAALAQCVRNLYDRDIESLGRAARARVLSSYTWDKAMQMQVATYANLVGAKSRQSSLSPAHAPVEIAT
jgi:alpha-1,6-mannosyltransferase